MATMVLFERLCCVGGGSGVCGVFCGHVVKDMYFCKGVLDANVVGEKWGDGSEVCINEGGPRCGGGDGAVVWEDNVKCAGVRGRGFVKN